MKQDKSKLCTTGLLQIQQNQAKLKDHLSGLQKQLKYIAEGIFQMDEIITTQDKIIKEEIQRREEEKIKIHANNNQDELKFQQTRQINQMSENKIENKQLNDIQNIDDCIQILRDQSRMNKNQDKSIKQKKTDETFLINKLIEVKKQQENKNFQLEKLKIQLRRNHKIQQTKAEEQNIETQYIEFRYLKDLYKKSKLEKLNEELRNYSDKFDSPEFDIIDFQEKCHQYILNKNNEDQNTNSKECTLYEFCILTQKYRHIKRYCHSKLKLNGIYTLGKYFDYCKQGNVEAIYYCVVEGVDPEISNTYDNGKNAFAYACEGNYINMLKMLIDDFQVRPDYAFDYIYQKNERGRVSTIQQCTGFMLACSKNDTNMVKLLIDKYPEIIEQRDFNGVTGFILACNNNNVEVVKLLIKENPKVIEQENNYGHTGYSFLSNDSKKQIINHIKANNLNIKKPRL